MLAAVKPRPIIMYRVGKHSRPLSDYAFWARWLIRAVYFWTGYQVTAEDIAIASDEETAHSMCLDDSYFYKPLYVDVALPPEQCTIGPVVWPQSEARDLYKRHSPDGVFLTRDEFNMLEVAVSNTTRSIHA